MSNPSFLGNLKVRFTPPEHLNDPRELCPQLRIRNPSEYAGAIVDRNIQTAFLSLLANNQQMTPEEAISSISKASLDTLRAYTQGNETIEKKIHEIVLRQINKQIGVFSLTETDNNELMWSHYAGNHTGYVVGFDTNTDFFSRRKNDPIGCGELMNVIYSDNTPVVYVDPGNLEIPKELFFTKTTKWQYEREWRMIRMLSTADTTAEPSIHLFEIPPESIVSITFGLKFPDEGKRDTVANFSKRVSKVTFMQASYNHRSEFVIS
jgi:hypothetical protein